MPQALVDMCSIVDISNPYLSVNPPRLPVPVHLFQLSWKKNGAGFRENSWIKIKKFANPVPVRGNFGVHEDRPDRPEAGPSGSRISRKSESDFKKISDRPKVFRFF